ncbi:MAG: NAD(P)-binding domain-containing protein [Geminicoccaceae bacterium]|nr:NAD(P)-binding domain-containing protein [Geminicoccaceae bacterium]MDW8125914.1 NAD(P)-binding domain-containing protein [Geminicoccaceae bacterium]MDW8342738.1 NAD(P)-binding domain-containing protein [Geminicoccaceae bacterium]
MRVVLLGALDAWLSRTIAAGLAPLARASDLEAAGAAERRGVEPIADLAELVVRLSPPRFFLLDAPPDRVDAVIDEASRAIEPGDVVLDCARSWWCDTLRRHRRLRHRALHHLDVAEARGPAGPLLLVGGRPDAVALARPLLETLARPGRMVVAGGPGAAHWAGEVTAALATARARAESEARALLEAFPGGLDAEAVAAALGFGETAADGRAAWLPDDALRLQAPAPLLALAAMQRLEEALEELEDDPPPPRLGPFAWPREIL